MPPEETPRRADQAFTERAGQAWAKLQDRTDAMLDGLGRAALAALPLAPGASVLDVGCGCGQTLLELAEVVGASGRVVGVDISPPMLARARELTAGRPEVTVVLADAQAHAFPPGSFDAIYSRFGVMFFQDARAAFANLRAALRPGGRLAFVCWQPVERNPWAGVPLAAVMRLRPGAPLPELLHPDLPGPFYLGDPARIRAILADAGFSAIDVAPWQGRIHFGGAMNQAEALDYARQIGPAARAIADAPEAERPALEEALAAALAPFVGERGVWSDGAAWIVTARA